MNFDWDSYLQASEEKGVNHESFGHVEQSLRSRIPADCVCEVEVGEDEYWFAHVKLACGQLVYLTYIDLAANQPPARYEWLHLNRQGLHRLGFARAERKRLKPKPLKSEVDSVEKSAKVCESTESQSKESSVEDYYRRIHKLKEDSGWIALNENIKLGASSVLVDLIRSGTQYELREADDPHQFWMVRVTENHGGLLGLSYASPELKPKIDLRLFYSDSRLQPCGTVSGSQGKYTFKVPHRLRARGYPEPVWKVLKASFSDSSLQTELPDSLLPKHKLMKHSFLEKMLLAVIDPRTEDKFRVAIVTELIDDVFFRISLLESPDVSLVCTKDSTKIGSIPWAISLGLLDKRTLQDMPCSPQSKIAPRSLFESRPKASGNFCEGELFEYLSNPDTLELNIARILEVREHIVKIQVMFEDDSREILLGTDSCQMFPIGWAASNNVNIRVPKSLMTHETSLSVEQNQSALHNWKESKVEEEEEETDKSSLRGFIEPVDTSSKPVLRGHWCPPIYFNHLCYSASFLRKSRLEALPRFIGPGPVRLVIREVLARLVGSSFKSGAVLKKLEVGERRRPNFWLETMKGKSRVLLLEGNVEVPSRAEQVTDFCREVCQKLECCPYLFGPISVGGECPSACQTRPKHEFLLEPSKPTKFKGRRGKKRFRKPEENGQEKGDDSSSDDTSATPSTANTREPSREGSPDRELAPPPLKRRRTSDTDPDSSLQQLKVKPTLKEMEEMEELIEESLRETSPPQIRPPSPKLLRSRSSIPPAQSPEADTLASLDLEAAFSYDNIPVPPLMMEPPPVCGIFLKSNPVLWTNIDVEDFMSTQKDPEISSLAAPFKYEQIDGMAFMLLNLPTILDHWQLKPSTAYQLCRLVEGVKLAFFVQFAHTGIRSCTTAVNSSNHSQKFSIKP